MTTAVLSTPLASAVTQLERWAREWRAPMLRFAQLHLQPREDAEDAVQDSLAALLEIAPETLARVDPRSYLFGVLKNKVTDRLRRKYGREVSYSDVFEDDLDEVIFDASGHWVQGVAPAAWKTPEEQLRTEQFFAVVDVCVNKLPAKPARVFSMKEFLECDPPEICTVLGLSQADYWQCMSRARKQIQLCLNESWFQGAAQ